MVENINFSAGGFDAKYGDKMSSVLDITYKKPKKFETSVSASLLGAGLYVGYAKKNFSMTHGVRYKTNQYMLGSLETKGEYNPRFLDTRPISVGRPTGNGAWTSSGTSPKTNMTSCRRTDRQFRHNCRMSSRFALYFDGKEEDSSVHYSAH